MRDAARLDAKVVVRELPVVRIGAAVRVPSLKLQRWIEDRTEQAA